MKKLYQLPKWKKHSRRRSMRELLKKQEQEALQHALNKAKAKTKEPPPYTGVTYIRKEHKFKIPVPEVFSLVKNVDEMLMFYKTIYAYAREKKGIFLEMSNIKQISVDAILYTISVFDHLVSRLRNSLNKCNAPILRLAPNPKLWRFQK
jgi:hypothetical protein